MKKWLKFHYPKLLLFVIAILIAYFIFKNNLIFNFISGLENLSYLGIFINGILIAFGFTAPIAIALFLVFQPQNIFIAALIGGLGALTGDLFIFKFVKISFQDEFNRLKNTKTLKLFSNVIDRNLNKKIKFYLLFLFAGFLIASPLPDEAGVTLLAGLTKIKSYVLAITSFILHTIVIYLILNI